MKVNNLFFTTVLLLFIFSCKNTSKKTNSEDSTLNHKLKYVQQIPDSLQTPEQKELVKKLLKITIEHVKVINNRMVFDMSKEQFSQTDIPIKYFNLFTKNMKENNKWIKKNNIQTVNRMVQENRQRMREELNEM